jgi:NAD(P)-dependent dehydrogenase (short-subunit alcohol dehydrogenase family)
VGRAFDQVLAEFGRIDIVVHSAGVDDPATKAKVGEHFAAGSPLEITSTLSDAQWDRMIAVNLSGTFYVLPGQRRRRVCHGRNPERERRRPRDLTGLPRHHHRAAPRDVPEAVATVRSG